MITNEIKRERKIKTRLEECGILSPHEKPFPLI